MFPNKAWKNSLFTKIPLGVEYFLNKEPALRYVSSDTTSFAQETNIEKIIKQYNTK